MQQAVYNCHWKKFVEVPPPTVLTVVKEFYANMFHVRQNKCFVRGQKVSFDAKTINAYYGIPKLPKDQWTPYYDKDDIDVNELTSKICYGVVPWEMTQTDNYKQFKVSCFTSEAKA